MQIIASFAAFLDSLPSWFTALTGVVSAASAITSLTPTPKDDKFVGKIVRILEVLALNIGHAKRVDRSE